MPAPQAMRHAQPLTASERNTTETSSGSAPEISCSAAEKLSAKVFMRRNANAHCCTASSGIASYEATCIAGSRRLHGARNLRLHGAYCAA